MNEQNRQEMIHEFRKLADLPGNKPILCSRMHFRQWADALETSPNWYHQWLATDPPANRWCRRSVVIAVVAVLFLLCAGYCLANPTDHAKALILVPDEWATHWAAQSGNWSDPATWETGVPSDNARVVIPVGVTVTQDVDTARLKTLRLDGTLQPAATCKCSLQVDTLVTTMGSRLLAGSSSQAFDGQWTIRFIDNGPVNDAWRIGRGAIILGEVGLYGSEVRPYQSIEGAAAGETAIRLRGEVAGWKAGDRLVVPGSQWKTNDDDESNLGDHSEGGFRLSAPLRFNHLTTDREGFPRPLVAANITPRSIHFESENKALDRRGHLMVMSDKMSPAVFSHVSFDALGRTDKSKPVTDPDGLGNGVANARGRYALHFHLRGPSQDPAAEAMVTSCIVTDSPGWGFVNHGSAVSFIGCVAYKVFGAHFVGENGNETGYVSDCVAIRSTNPSPRKANVQNLSSGGTNADWGKDGTGIWTHCGGIRLSNNLIYGMGSFGITLMGVEFKIGTNPPVKFEAANLLPPYVWNPKFGDKTKVHVAYVPQSIEGGAIVGCAGGIGLWGLNGNGSEVPPIGRATIKGVYINSDGIGIHQGYLSNLDIEDCRCVRTTVSTTDDGTRHTGVNTSCNLRRCEFYGYDTGIRTISGGVGEIVDCKFRCREGIEFGGIRGSGRVLTILRPTFLPGTQVGVSGQLNLIAGEFRTGNGSTPWMSFFTGDAAHSLDDTTTLDGRYLFMSEENPTFPMSQAKKTPLEYQSDTTASLRAKGLYLMGRQVPDDAVPLTGSDCLVSDSPAIPKP